MIYYVVQPMPGMHVVKQIVFDGILVVILGAVMAFMYRSQAPEPEETPGTFSVPRRKRSH